MPLVGRSRIWGPSRERHNHKVAVAHSKLALGNVLAGAPGLRKSLSTGALPEAVAGNGDGATTGRRGRQRNSQGSRESRGACLLGDIREFQRVAEARVF